jgi:hypothetical protein
MASYYKFAERQADSFVNWAEIGKGITDMIQTEAQIREDKRTAIDQATRDNLKRVAEAPVGTHEGLNTWTLNYADSAREAILLQDRLLKSGALKLKDYTVMRQNLNDGTDELFGVIKNFQNTFKEKRDRLISNDPKNKSQQLEMDLMSYTEQFADFSKSSAIIDPRNFTVNVGIMESDPNNKGVMKVGKQIATSSFLRKIQNTKVDYFDSDGAAEVASKSFGGFAQSTIQDLNRLQGKVVTVEDVRKRPGYEEAINDELNSFFANPFNMTSILTNDLVKDKNGKQYVSNISGKDGNVIEFVFDAQTNYYKPNLTAEQEQAARDYMRRKIEQRLDIKLKEDPFNKPQPKEVKAEDPNSGPSIDVQDTFLTRVKERTGLGVNTFSPSGSKTATDLQGVLATIPGGTQLSVAPDEEQDGLVNLKDGDQIIKSFNVLGINKDTQQKYLNEFTEIISNLAGMNGMVDYLGRTGGVGQSGSGGVNYGDK